MLNVQVVAVALMTAAVVACTNTEPTTPEELEAEPQQAGSTAAKGTSREESAELEPEPSPAAPDEETLPGLPEPAPASGQAPSTSPLCGTGLTCSGTSVAGGKACRQQTSSVADVYCCPRKGDRIVNGECVAKLCGSGLVCSSTSLPGASACRQYTTSTANVYCCPSGQSIMNGRCQ